MRIIRPDSPEYDCARRVVNKRIDQKPSAIIFCNSTEDVQEAVRMSVKNGKKVRIRSGRHSYEGFSVGGGDSYVIDVSELNSVNVDQNAKRAKVGAGAQLYYDLYRALWNQGKLTLPGGSCPTVGIGGLAAGGGLSFSGRHYGLTCDSIMGLTIVTASGDILNIDSQNHEELFWACCGAGNGNFGIITSYDFKLYPAPDVSIYSVSWKWNKQLPAISQAWFEMLSNTPNELMPFLRFSLTKDGPLLSSFGQYYGPQDQLEAIVKKYFGSFSHEHLSFDTLTNIDAIRHWGGIPIPGRPRNFPHYMAHHHNHQEKSHCGNEKFVFHDGGYFKASSIMLDRFFNQGELEYILDGFPDKSKINSFIVLDGQKNGVSSKLPDDFNAYAHRNALSSVQIFTSWENPEEEGERIQFIEEIRRNLQNSGMGAYRNYCDILIENWQKAYYKNHYSELMKIKEKYDPLHLFTYAQAVSS